MPFFEWVAKHYICGFQFFLLVDAIDFCHSHGLIGEIFPIVTQKQLICIEKIQIILASLQIFASHYQYEKMTSESMHLGEENSH